MGVLVHTVVGGLEAGRALLLTLLNSSAAVGFGAAGAGLSALSRPMEIRS